MLRSKAQGPPPPTLTFGAAAVADGPASSATCALFDNYYVDGPHFNPNPPTTTFADPGGDPGLCGDLTFDSRTRSFTTIYASASPEESPWKYWWQRARSLTTGSSMGLAEVRKVSRAVDLPDTATVQMWLSDQYDVIGTQLILSGSAGETLSEQAFTEPPANPGMNIAIQHWRHIDPPGLNTATMSGDDITLAWTNTRPFIRSVDSTNIYRNGVWRATVGPSATSFVDGNLAPGTYTYTLKHLSLPFAHWSGPPMPNSASSNALQVTVPPPPALTVTITGPTWIDSPGSYSWIGLVSGGTLPYSRQWWYKPFGPGGSWQQVGSAVKYTRTVTTGNLGFKLRHDVTEAGGLVGSDTVDVFTSWGYGPQLGRARTP